MSVIIDPDERCIYLPAERTRSKKHEMFVKIVSYVLGENLVQPKYYKNRCYHPVIAVLRPFQYAHMMRKFDVLKYYIMQNSDMINTIRFDSDNSIASGLNILEMSVMNKDLEMLKFLLKHGGNVMTTNSVRDRELDLFDYCILRYKFYELSEIIEMIDYLENQGVKRKYIDIAWITNADTRKDFEIVDYLFKKYTVKWEKRDQNKFYMNYFLGNALAYNKIYILKYFLKKGLDVNLVEDKSDSIAQMAVFHKRVKFLSEIIKDVDLEYKNSSDETVFEIAKKRNAGKCIDIIEKEMERRSKMDLKH